MREFDRGEPSGAARGEPDEAALYATTSEMHPRSMSWPQGALTGPAAMEAPAELLPEPLPPASLLPEMVATGIVPHQPHLQLRADDETLDPAAPPMSRPSRGDSGRLAGAFPPSPAALRRCPRCVEEMPFAHRFCGNCGERFDGAAPTIVPAGPSATGAPGRTLSPGTREARGRLVVIRGEGLDGVGHLLDNAETVVGRSQGSILFPDDRLLSPKHATFFYRDGALMVRDEGSRNGVFQRIRGSVTLEPGQAFLIGEQLLALMPGASSGLSAPDLEGTYFYGSPRRASRMHVLQFVGGGALGMAMRGTGDSLSIGRDGNQLNFPDDPFISGHHAVATALEDGRFRIEDLNSKNGTFARVKSDTRLEHGDYVFIGQQLLRVEFT